MPASNSKARYSIASVSKLTGVSCHTLRVWERRYGFPVPLRSEKGQRRYSAATVDALCRIAELQKSGRAISSVIAEYLATPSPAIEQAVLPRKVEVTGEVIPALLDAITRGDESKAAELLDEWQAKLDIPSFVSRVLEPAMVEVGERWFRGQLRVYHEHFATTLFLRRLDRIIDEVKKRTTPPTRTALICTVQGDRHEGGVRILALSLELMGWRSVVMGVDIPVEELGKAVLDWKPDAVAVSFVLSRNINKRFDELRAIKQVPVFVGGRSITNYQRLARRYGLIPLASDVFSMAEHWESEIQDWRERETNAE